MRPRTTANSGETRRCQAARCDVRPVVADDIPVADEIDITGFSFSGLIFEGPEWGAFLPGSRRPLPAIQDNFPAACKRTLIDEAIRRAIAQHLTTGTGSSLPERHEYSRFRIISSPTAPLPWLSWLKVVGRRIGDGPRRGVLRHNGGRHNHARASVMGPVGRAVPPRRFPKSCRPSTMRQATEMG